MRYQLGRCRDVWPINEEAGIPPHGWQGWSEGKQFALVLTHDVDTAKGQGKCIQLARLEESLGFRSSFNFVPEGYSINAEVRRYLIEKGSEVGVHGLNHSENPFRSRKVFRRQTPRIKHYLKEWGSAGFRAPCMYHNLDWIGELNIEYDASTFDTDPFEPQPDGVGTIFPFWVHNKHIDGGFVELPYTLPQDFTLFILMQEKDAQIWQKKLDWIVQRGGMALVNVHPDYMSFNGEKPAIREYPASYYREFLIYIKENFKDRYWHVLPRDMSRFWAKHCLPKNETLIENESVP